MGLATQPSQLPFSYLTPPKVVVLARPQPGPNSPTSMSQGFHQGAGLFCFSEGFDRSANQDQQQHQHIAQQSRRDKLRVQGFDASGHPFVPIEDQGDEPAIYESATVGAGNMLSDLFGFPAPGPTAIDLHANQIPGSYHLPLRPAAMTGFSGDWYGTNRQANQQQQQHLVTGLNTDSAAAMQLFLMNPPLQPQPPQQQHPRSPSPPPTLHQQHQAFQSFGETPFGGRVVEGQGLSLSLSSSLQQLEMAKADELRVREETLYFNNQQQHPLHLQGVHVQGGSQAHGHGQQLQMGYGGGMGVMNVLRNSKYAKAAQELLEEFCSVGRGQLKGSRARRHHGGSSNTNRNPSSGGGGASSSAGASTSSSKDVPPLSPADRFEHQRKKAKLISMLDEVDRRYSHYCDQMQMVVNSFDSVMGFGAATPYTALARKAMSRHFRCLKDAIAAQLKQTCEVLGEKEGLSSSGITKGETPRLRLLDQSLRQQRAFNHMGMMQEQEAWRPQRGLPERSVNVLRGWLFEHFLHPYPSDADKHLLARQTGLSRNQVANWFINARVRLWKPMVEEMYTQESKEEGEEGESDTNQQTIRAQSPKQQQQGQRPESNAAPESDVASPSTSSISQRNYRLASTSENLPPVLNDGSALIGADVFAAPPDVGQIGDMFRYGAAAAAASSSALGPAARMRLGAAGDVSLTLGLRHAAGSTPEKNRFSVGDFGGC